MIVALLSVIIGTVIATVQFYQGEVDILLAVAWIFIAFGLMSATAIYTDLLDRLEKLEGKKKK